MANVRATKSLKKVQPLSDILKIDMFAKYRF
jgi:hypothetical protein